jgi:hypothetical protein
MPKTRLSLARRITERARGRLEPERKASLVISKPPSPPRVQLPAASILKELAREGARFATLLLTKNVNPKAVSDMLGHSNIAITVDTYFRVLPNMQESAARSRGSLPLTRCSTLAVNSPGANTGAIPLRAAFLLLLQELLEYRRSGSNRHGAFAPPDFESGASTNSATPAREPHHYTNAQRSFRVSSVLP